MDTPPAGASPERPLIPPPRSPRRRRVLLWLGAAAAAVVLILVTALPIVNWRSAHAYALLHVAREEPRLLPDGSRPPTTKEDFESYRQTQVVLIKSGVVLNAALRKPEVAKLSVVRAHADPVEWLQGELEVDFDLAPEIMRVGLSGTNGAELATVVNAVTDAYMDEIVDKQRKLRADQADELEHIKERYAGLLEVKRKNLQEILENKDDAGARQKVQTQLEAALKQLAAVRDKLRRIEAAAPDEAAGKVPERAIEDQVDKDPEVQRILQGIAKLNADREKIEQDKDGAHSAELSRSTRTRLEEMRKELEARRANVRPPIEKQFKAQLLARAAAQKEHAQRLKRLEKLLNEDVDNLSNALRRLDTKKGNELALALKLEIEPMEKMWKRISAQVEMMKVEKDGSSRVQKLVPASATVRKGDWFGALLKGLGL